jgi:hypothetical protein
VRQGIGFLRTELPTILCDAHRCPVTTHVACRSPWLSKVPSVDQRMRLECGVGFRATHGRAVAHVRGSYAPDSESGTHAELMSNSGRLRR